MTQTDTAKTIGSEIKRRDFLNRLWLFLGILSLAELAGLVIVFLKSHKPGVAPLKKEKLMPLGNIAEYKNDSVTTFRRGGFYLVRLQDGSFLALSRKCTHLGCTVAWSEDERKFICPCHASAFDTTGKVLKPPAPRALDYLPIHIENDMIAGDISLKIRRTQFQTGQITP